MIGPQQLIRESHHGIILVVLGLYVCFIASTVFQEELYAFRRDPVVNTDSGERFESAPLLTLIKSLSNILVSRSVIYFRNNDNRIKPSGTAPLVIAAIRCLSTILSLYSLNFISYPYLILGRSIKIVPVLVSEVLFDRRFPSTRRCSSFFVTTSGLLMFSISSSFKQDIEERTAGNIGFFLLFLSLCADGVISFSQKHMVNEKKEKPRVFELMLHLASWQALFSFIMVVFSWREKGGVSFCLENPKVMGLMLWPSIIESIGQIFIYELIINHGPFFTSMITTLRKFITILLSVIIFGHVLTVTQWVSILMVFFGCSIDMKKPSMRK